MRLPRPGFSGTLVMLALVTTVALGVCGARGAEAANPSDAHVEDELARLGFRSLDAPATRAPDAGRSAAGADGANARLFAAGRFFRLGLPNGEITGEPLGDREASAAASLVRVELARYPSEFVSAVHLRRVLLTRDLREAGNPIPSLPNCGGALLLDVDGTPAFLRRLLHHEVFHFADVADDGTLKADAEWEALNDHFFVYGDGGRAARDPGASLMTDAYPGFLDAYSRSAVEEDKAEVFAFLMTDPAGVARVAAHDPIVAAKVRAVRERTARVVPTAPSCLAPAPL